jgi:translocation protein SEC62
MLLFLAALSVVRFMIFLFFFHFGIDIWILPNLYNDDIGFFDTFRPLYSYEKRDDDTKMFFFRIMCGICVAYTVV